MNEGGKPEREGDISVIFFNFTLTCTEPSEDSYVVVAEVVQANGVTGRVTAEHNSLENAEQVFSAHEKTAMQRGFKCIERDTLPGDNWVSMSRWIPI